MNNALPLIGCDPEFFVANESGEIDSAIGFLGGTKEDPLPVPGGFLQEDNVLIELNTEPTADPVLFSDSISRVLGEAEKILQPKGRYVSLFRKHFTYPSAKILSWGDQAVRFGCDPDYNVYTEEPNTIPTGFTGFRSAGGHIHIGWNHLKEVSKEDQHEVVKMADYILGLWGVVNGDSMERRKLYGKAGCFRYKPYGVEYRTLGNFWVSSNGMRIEAFKRAQVAYLQKDMLPVLEDIIQPKSIQEIINEGLTVEAMELLSLVEEVLGYGA